jgi:phycocyanobilin lyase subunit alpha
MNGPAQPTPNPTSESLTIEQAIQNLQGEDLGLRFYAAWWLGKFRVADPVAIRLLIQALKDDTDRTPEGSYPLRRNAARALGKLGDQSAVAGLITCLDCSDFYVREAAAQSLEMLQDKTCIPILVRRLKQGLDLSSGAPQLVAQQPDMNEPYDSLLEALGTLRAQDAIDLIAPFLEHSVARTQYAADRAMYQLTGDAQYGDRLITALDGKDLQLRRAALADVGAIGYLPAAQAIANTLAENSLKLISLKGLLEHQIDPLSPDTLSEGAIQIMDLMDGLL